jgi:hypothetical protein
MILMAADGLSNDEIAARLDTGREHAWLAGGPWVGKTAPGLRDGQGHLHLGRPGRGVLLRTL